MAMANTDPGTARSGESRVLRRSRTDRVIGGVCGGLGAYFGLDPALFRIAFVILALAGGGAGLPIYLVAWIITPEGESTPPGSEARSTNPASLVMGTIFVAIGLGLLAEMMFPWFDRMLWPALLVGLGVFVITGARRGIEMNTAPAPVGARRFPAGRAVAGVVLVAIGSLWLLDTAGVSNVDWFYVLPAVLGLMGLAMLAGVGGRSASALIPLGYLLIAVMFIGTLAQPRLNLNAGVGNRSHAPSASETLKNKYGHGMGTMELDLRGVSLDESREVRASVGMGELVVRVPESTPVDILASAGLGDVSVFGQERGGVAPELRFRSQAPGDDRVLTLELSVGMGSVEVRR